MAEAGLLAGVIGAGYLGFALLALSQGRHWRRVLGFPPPSSGQVRVLRGFGAAALVLSLVLALFRDGPGFGAIVWVTVLSLAAIAVALTLTWRAQWLKPLAWTVRGRQESVP